MKINDNGINRNMTAEEEKAHLAWAEVAQAEANAFVEMQTAKASAREALLTRLGITEAEAQLLLGA